jgi:hypothetical protein
MFSIFHKKHKEIDGGEGAGRRIKPEVERIRLCVVGYIQLWISPLQNF